VERRECRHGVELRPLGLPRLEVGHDDLGQRKRGEVPSRHRGKLFPSSTPTTANPRAASATLAFPVPRPDLEDPALRRDRRQGDEIVDDRVGVRRPRGVVASATDSKVSRSRARFRRSHTVRMMLARLRS
jgi:hypothetical protein